MFPRLLALLLGFGLTPLLLAQDYSSTLQIHGFATQGLLYSRHNNYLEVQSSDGDPGWTEAVVSLTDQPTSKLRIGVQIHYLHLGDLGGDAPFIDWASGDYKFNDYIGLRAGKIKTALGLFNDSQDIDAVFLWSLLPQATYAIDNRSFFLSHLGGEVYGSLPLGERAGHLHYRVYGGTNSIDKNGGIAKIIANATGLQFATAPSGPITGADLRWTGPFKPLTLGVSLIQEHNSGYAPTGKVFNRSVTPVFYAQYDRGRLYLAAEYRRQPSHITIQLGPYQVAETNDQRQSYVMLALRATSRLQVGTYYSRSVTAGTDTHLQGNNVKDFVLSTRFDVNPNFYLKAEEHFYHGTMAGFYPDDNTGTLTSRTAITIAKVGFTF